MPSSPYRYQHYLLRSVASQLRLPTTEQLARMPGTKAVYRITCYCESGLTPTTVTTVMSQMGRDAVMLIHSMDSASAFQAEVSTAQMAAVVKALAVARFDRLPDQPGIPAHGATLWLVARAAGSFVKRVLLAPANADGVYSTLLTQLQQAIADGVGVARSG